MGWQGIPYLLVLFFAAFQSAVWAAYSVRYVRRHGFQTHVVAFAVLSIGVTVWASLYGLQVATTDQALKYLFYRYLHVGAVLVQPAWILFALGYSGHDEWVTPRIVALVSAIPLVFLVLILFDPQPLALVEVSVETTQSLRVLDTENGPVYYLFLGSSYVLLLIGAALIAAQAVRRRHEVAAQSALLLAAVSVPFVASLFEVFDLPPVSEFAFNPTPLSLSVSVLCFGLALFRYRLFDVSPIARTAVLGNMAEGVVVLDDRERVIDVNPAARELLSVSDGAVGTAAAELLPEYERIGADDDPTVDVTLEADDGDETRSVHATRSELRDGGVARGAVVILHDVTVRERQRRALERQNERLDAFASTVAHDLRRSLSKVDTQATLGERTGETDYYADVRETVASIHGFVEDLLVLARHGEAIEAEQSVSLASLVADVSAAFDERELHVDVAANATVLADPGRLRQVIENLLRNAVEHGSTDSSDPVHVRVGDLDDGFYVEDDGPGIAEADRERVFEYGYSTDDGTGIGLAIVADVVAAHDWTVEVPRGTTGGARFEVTGVDVVEAGRRAEHEGQDESQA